MQSRPIKFRAWDRLTKTMFEPMDLRSSYARLNGFGSQGYELMQYTGLKDKNGKEIYEGDIVKIHNYKETWKRGEPKIDWRVFEIRWNRYLWSFNNSVISKPLADYDTTDLMPYDIEIIGNIYENPELLN